MGEAQEQGRDKDEGERIREAWALEMRTRCLSIQLLCPSAPPHAVSSGDDVCRRISTPALPVPHYNTWGATLPSITHIVFSQAGPLSCKPDLTARLEDGEDDFDNT